MKVTGCETLHCDAGWRDFSFLKVTTDEGVTGVSEYNECYGSPGLSGVIERLVADRVVGEDPLAISRMNAKLYATTRQAPGGMVQQAIAAIENALLDIKGRALGVPVFDLLGGAVRDRLELYWSHCGTYRFGAPARHLDLPPIETLDDLAALGGHVRDRGFRGLKTNIFLFDENGDEGGAAPPHAGLRGLAGLARAQWLARRHRTVAPPARRAPRRCGPRRRHPPRLELQLQARGLPPGDPGPRRLGAHLVRDRPLRPGEARPRPHPPEPSHPPSQEVVRVAVRHPRQVPATYFEHASMDVAIIDIAGTLERRLGGTQDRVDGGAVRGQLREPPQRCSTDTCRR